MHHNTGTASPEEEGEAGPALMGENGSAALPAGVAIAAAAAAGPCCGDEWGGGGVAGVAVEGTGGCAYCACNCARAAAWHGGVGVGDAPMAASRAASTEPGEVEGAREAYSAARSRRSTVVCE